MTTNRGLQALQREAWAFGRSLRDSLLADFEGEYGEPAPPPALIGGELLTWRRTKNGEFEVKLEPSI